MNSVWKSITREGVLKNKNISFMKKFSNKTGKFKSDNHYDIAIIGGGAIGSSVAYWCKNLAKKNFRIIVVDRDPTYKIASTVLSVGGLRQQFSNEENIEMSLFGADFVCNVDKYLHVDGDPPVDVQFHQYGYLTLSKEETVDIMRRNSKLQCSLGAKNILLNKNQLKDKFPWLNVDDIELGCLGVEKEGWFDPWSLLLAFKRKAISMGVEYISAEAKSFNFKENLGKNEEIKSINVETEDGQLREISFDKCVIAAGAFSANVAKMAKVGKGPNCLSVPLPVEPRKRYVYYFHAPDGPGLSTPQTFDPTGAYFRREGLDNNYLCGVCPCEEEEPPIDNLDVDHDFFNEKLWPIIANRVPAFENLKVKSSWAGYYEYNTFDQNGIIGMHPYYDNIYFATGFSGHGIQQSPAAGRAISELIAYGKFTTIDLSRLGFERFIKQQPVKENNIW